MHLLIRHVGAVARRSAGGGKGLFVCAVRSRTARYVRSTLALLSLALAPLAAIAQSTPAGGGTQSGGAPAPAQGSGAASAPAAVVHTSHPTVYVFALSFDNPTQYAISVEAASYLAKFVAKAKPDVSYQSLSPFETAPAFAPTLCRTVSKAPPKCKQQITSQQVWLVPEPGWTLASYINQCQSDPENTVGALVFGAVENDTGSFNWFAWISGYTKLSADASFITCEPRSKDEFLSLDSRRLVVGTQSQSVTGNSQAKSYSLSYAIQTSPAPSTKNKDYLVPKKAKIVSITTGTTQSKAAQALSQSLALAPLPTPTPAMNMIWDAQTSLHGNANQGGFPLYLVVAVASYFAAHGTTTTTTCTPTSTAVAASQCKSNNSWLGTGIAVAAGIFSSSTLAAVTVGGSNPSRQLSQSAGDLSEKTAVRLRDDCSVRRNDAALKWLCTTVFNEEALKSDPALQKYPTSSFGDSP